MAMSDLFYPGNPERREKIIRRSQELIELMKNNFRATNNLTEIVNMHLGTSFRPITLDEKATVKENCYVMNERVHEIQARVEKFDEELKMKLEPTLYEKIQNLSRGSQGFNTLKGALAAVCQVSAAVLVTYLIKNITVLKNITSTCAKIAGGVFATIVLGLLLDMIVSAIVGHIERAELEKTLAEYDAALDKFKPASEKYQDAITEVKVMIKCLNKE